jgi:hypothetical protein
MDSSPVILAIFKKAAAVTTFAMTLSPAFPHIVFRNPSYCGLLFISWKLPFTFQSWGKRSSKLLIVSEGRAWRMVVATRRNNRPRQIFYIIWRLHSIGMFVKQVIISDFKVCVCNFINN